LFVVAGILVQVLGFSDVERHSFNTLFRLSSRQIPSYQLWTPESASPPHVAVIDGDSYEAMLELESPSFNPNLKIISVGSEAPERAWRHFTRPVDWTALIGELDVLFASIADMDFDLETGEIANQDRLPPGLTQCMLVGLNAGQRLYLRARLALAGFTQLEEVETLHAARHKLALRRYELVIVDAALEFMEDTEATLPISQSREAALVGGAWDWVEQLKTLPTVPRSLVLACTAPTGADTERAEKLGCKGLLEIPFVPRQVANLLQKI
jgi:hypothetical protein